MNHSHFKYYRTHNRRGYDVPFPLPTLSVNTNSSFGQVYHSHEINTFQA